MHGAFTGIGCNSGFPVVIFRFMCWQTSHLEICEEKMNIIIIIIQYTWLERAKTFYVKMAWTQYTMRMTEKCCYSLLNIPTPSHPSPSHATWISPLSCRWYGSCPCGQQSHQRGTPGGFSFAHPWSEWNAASPLPAIMYRSTVLSRQLQCIHVHTDDVVIFSFRNSIPLSSASVCNIALHLWARTSLLSCVSLSSCSRHIQAVGSRSEIDIRLLNKLLISLFCIHGWQTDTFLETTQFNSS